jgi:hypothetical protein
MKKFLNTAILLAMVTTCTTIAAQPQQKEYLGLPGDNLNLYAVMKLFQESETLEGFERKLNDENSRINNLDLNGDNLIDYIRVVDYVDKNVHNIVLRVAINKHEDQDVAVFTVQRFNNGQVQVQLIGDQALYGKNYIIEPIYDDQYANETPNPGYVGNSSGTTVVRTTYYEVAEWPLVRFIYMPGYIEWHSSWYWGYYPPYWHPWMPYYWDFYYGYHYNWYHDYYRHYHHCDHYRYDHWNDFYYSSRRSYSPYVSHGIRDGHYEATYSHPDQRRQGEALYERTNHDQTNRRADQSHGNETARRSGSHTDQNMQQRGNSFSTNRRANTTMSRTNSEIASTANSGAERRTANTFGNRSANTAAVHNAGNERRSVAVSNQGSSGRPAASNNTFAERRSAPTRMDRQVAASKPAQSFANSRPTRQPAARSESFASHRSSGQSQSVKSARSSESKKSGEHGNSDHRR